MPKFMVDYPNNDWVVIEAEDLAKAKKLAGDNATAIKEMREIPAVTGADFVANLKRKLGRI